MTNEENSKSKESFLLSVPETEKVFDTDIRTGLSDAQAVSRQQTCGKNKMAEGKRKSLVRMFFEQFKDFLILVLVAAAIISGFLGEISDAILILIIVILNAVIGMVQENKAENSMEALKKLTIPEAKVLRDGVQTVIKAEDRSARW